MGKEQAVGGSIIIWKIFFSQSIGPVIHMRSTLSLTIYLNTSEDQVHMFIATSLMTAEYLIKTKHLSMLHELYWNVPSNFSLSIRINNRL